MIEFSRPDGETTQLTPPADKILLFSCPDDRNIHQFLNRCPADNSECTRWVRSHTRRYILNKMEVPVVPSTKRPHNHNIGRCIMLLASLAWNHYGPFNGNINGIPVSHFHRKKDLSTSCILEWKELFFKNAWKSG